MLLFALIFLSFVSCGDSGHANYNSLLSVVAIRVGQRSGQLLALSSNMFVRELENSRNKLYASIFLGYFQGLSDWFPKDLGRRMVEIALDKSRVTSLAGEAIGRRQIVSD